MEIYKAKILYHGAKEPGKLESKLNKIESNVLPLSHIFFIVIFPVVIYIQKGINHKNPLAYICHPKAQVNILLIDIFRMDISYCYKSCSPEGKA